MTAAIPPQADDGFRWRPTAQQTSASRLAALLRHVGLGSYHALVAWSREEPDRFWASILEFSGIRFYRPYERLCDLSEGVQWPRWCVGGTTNLVLNTLDRQIAAGRGAHPALVWVGEDGRSVSWDYDELQRQTCRIAASLVKLGCKAGDSVALFMPILPETVAVFYAVAKIGAIALPLFSGFGADAVATRVNAGGARLIVTADGARRRGKTLPMKTVIDAARPAMPQLAHVVVLDALGCGWDRQPGDLGWDEFLAGAPTDYPTAQLDAEAPLMVLYTSGTTGVPKGAVHTHVGFLAKMSLDYNIFNETGPDDRFIWMSDLGWLVGPAQIATTGMVGATLVLAEGVPDYPANDRLLRLASQHKVTVFGLSPTLARMMKAGVSAGAPRIDMSAIRIVISGGEPWDLPTWEWTMDYMCRGVAPIMNHCGGTEIGTLVLSSILDPMKPGGFSGPAPGTGADIVDADGRSLPPGEIGELVMKQASMGTTRGLWKDRERYLESYWSRIPGMWVQGDLASRDAQGIWYVHGRSDDTLKIAGKRTGPTEIETALLSSGELGEACAVGVPDAVKGYALVCVVVPRPDTRMEGLPDRLKAVVVSKLGASYAPKEVITVEALPKNRTGKLVRRLVRNALSGQPLGDLSSIVNPDAVDVLRARAAA
ncbi:Acetyl-coenzyme A synthetase [Variovorax sp. SRS16]|uniref:AMP-binding protein n=1 Tax=Variovorax sp. SRS16 TaxID=282217 RepID=UPI00131729DF|nr:AMP-binding protein [Variovorax sp. SRS16]VTU29920.1 Acetyl-coenzyme A synthetase [Variovorax sp. SRS16]